MAALLLDMYDPVHVQGKVRGSSGSKKGEGKKVSELSTKKEEEGKQKVHSETQKKKAKNKHPNNSNTLNLLFCGL
jgi:hypothetical protein